MASTTAIQTIIIGNKAPTVLSTDINAVPWHQMNPAISSNPLAKLNSLDIIAHSIHASKDGQWTLVPTLIVQIAGKITSIE